MVEDDRTHRAARVIAAAPAQVYAAFVDAEAMAEWMPPDGVSARIEAFEPQPGGRLRMVLTFADAPGKSSADSDVVEARFVRLVPDAEMVLAVEFESEDAAFAGTMVMHWRLATRDAGTAVSVVAEDVPPGIDKAVHEAAMAETLGKLARFVEGRR